MFKKLAFIVFSFYLALIFVGCTSGQVKNEKWMPQILTETGIDKIYIPDFSFAGYRWGESEIPNLKATMIASEFGAIPNDGKDDTEALKRAFASAHKIKEPVVLKLNPGKYILRDIDE